MNSQNHITRRKTRQIMVGNVAVGGDAPISVQSMTNTETCDVDATLKQIQRLVTAGVDIVRVSVPSMDAAAAFKEIRSKVNVPLVADIHFDHLIALQVLESGVDCLRINPGNIGSEKRIRAVVDSAKDKGIPLRIGVNAGSLGKTLLRKYKEPSAEAMVESALTQIDILDKLDFQNFKISLKASEIFMTLTAYRQLATQIDQPLHLGITEAGKDQLEGVRDFYDAHRLPSTRGADRPASAPRYYRGGRPAFWHGQVCYRAWRAVDGGYWRHDPHIAGR